MISRLITDNWVANKNEELFIETPNIAQVETAIRNLDGKAKTLVILEQTEDAHMAIGGGECGKYIVYVTFDNINFYNLYDPSKEEGTELLVVGGQRGDYSSKMCVSLDLALQTAKGFFETCQLDSSTFWKKD